MVGFLWDPTFNSFEVELPDHEFMYLKKKFFFFTAKMLSIKAVIIYVPLNNKCIFTQQCALCDFSTFVILMRDKVISS